MTSIDKIAYMGIRSSCRQKFVSFKKIGAKHFVPELVLESDSDFMDFKNAQYRIKNYLALKQSIDGNLSHPHLPPSIKPLSKGRLLIRPKEKLLGQLSYLKSNFQN